MLEIKDLKNVDKRQKFYRAVVEDFNDPEKLGRVRVRILGLHSDSLSDVPVNTLPWAEVISEIKHGHSAGVGSSAVPVQGTWVWIFLDNDDINFPVVFGAIKGKLKGTPKIEGNKAGDAFKNPDGKYPYADRCNESEMNRLARVEKISETIDTPQKEKQDKLDEFKSGKIEYDTLHDKSKYPHNNVVETQTGHHIIIDDSPGNERLLTYHRTGSYLEYRPDGSTIYKVIKDKHETTTGHFEEHIIGYVQTVIEKENIIHIKKFRETVINEYDYTYIKQDSARRIGATDFKDVTGAGTHIFGGDYSVTAPNIFLN